MVLCRILEQIDPGHFAKRYADLEERRLHLAKLYPQIEFLKIDNDDLECNRLTFKYKGFKVCCEHYSIMPNLIATLDKLKCPQ